jgi:protoporphyrin/coproporphyrin ferrochelatase
VTAADPSHDYDALLVVSFGGPEGPEDVLPFLDNVFRGLRVSPETVSHVAKRYEAFGGVSPINAQTRAFIKALQHELDAHGPALPIYWGNRNWHPLLTDTLAQMAHAGVRRALAYVTSTFGSYSSCRKYRENLYEAVKDLPDPPRIDKLRAGYNHPGFIEAMSDRVAAALKTLPRAERASAPLLFTAHSLPESMANASPYRQQLNQSCELVSSAVGHERWQLVYQSNNASYGREPWLAPDISEALRSVKDAGATAAVVAPIGFVCDHMEVVLDLDVQAAGVAQDIGLRMIRAGTVGTHPAYVAMVRELMIERITGDAPRRTLGTADLSHDRCPADCCLSGRPGPVKPALAGVDDPFAEPG